MLDRKRHKTNLQTELNRLAQELYQIRLQKKLTLKKISETSHIDTSILEKIELGLLPLKLPHLFYFSRFYNKCIRISLEDLPEN